jgi:adenylate cyclase
LESLAEPGGICISDVVHGQVRTKLSLRYQDLGQQRVKNIAEPVRVLRVLTDGTMPTLSPAERVGGSKRHMLVAASGGLLVAAIIYGVVRWKPLGRPAAEAPSANVQAIRSIAVLPLDNFSGDPKEDYFADGMTDELTTDLATISRLRVISRGSVMQFKGEHRPSTPEIAKLLNVDAVVEGSVLRIGDRIRITAQLIDAPEDRHLWAKSYERDSRDVLALQDEVASAIAKEINVELTPAEQARLTSAPVINPEGHDAYLKGRYFINRPSDENLRKAIAEFEEAARLDPNFAPAYSGLADAYVWAGLNEGIMSSAHAMPRAREAALRAVQLDAESAEAHTSVAYFKYGYEFDWTGAESEFRRAFELNPNYALAHDLFGFALAMQGRLQESLAEGKRAAELDPLSPQFLLDLIFPLAWDGKYQAAMEAADKAAELDPTLFTHVGKGWIHLWAGNVTAAIAELQRADTSDSPPWSEAWLGYAYGASGDRTAAIAVIEEMNRKSLHGYLPPFNLAIVYLGMGDYERAMDYLEHAYSAHNMWLVLLKMDRMFDPLRKQPRFIALMKKLNFAP